MENQDYSKPFIFNLSKQRPNKTIDIGCNGVSVSTDALGRILQFSIIHPDHGIAPAEPFEQFDGTKFRDPKYVRFYRTRMLRRLDEQLDKNEGGFGLDLGGSVDSVSIQIQNKSLACFEYTLKNELTVTYTTQVRENGEVIQTAKVTNNGANPIEHHFNLNLCLSLNRASYGQLTEGGPIPLPTSQNIFKKTTYEMFKVTNPHLNAQFEAGVEVGDKAFRMKSLESRKVLDKPLDVLAHGLVNIKSGASVVIKARMGMMPKINEERCNLPAADLRVLLPSDVREPRWKNQKSITTYIIRRNLDYILATCAIPTSMKAVAILADHVALPLGWNRDNAYAIRFLLEIYKQSDALMDQDTACHYREVIKKVVRGHLEWVFNVAERPEKFWGRSYLVTGRQKDKSTFQLDQQCYPLLELCDYADIFDDDKEFLKCLFNGNTVKEVLKCLKDKRDQNTGLFPTDETPGDDAVENPYHFSSHVLLWRTYTRLKELCAKIDPNNNERVQELGVMAGEVRDKTLKHFIDNRPDNSGGSLFAYSTDGRGKFESYHDANDVPTLLSKDWSFSKTPAEVQVWKNTMEFGLSEANPGFCKIGDYRGLGSRHSPGAWVLGYFQEMGYAVRTSNKEAFTSVWKRITAAMQWDGTFSEAVDSKTAKCSSKAWFAWPGAMIGTQLLQMRADETFRLWLDELKA